MGLSKKNLTFCGYTIFEEKLAFVLPLMVYSDVNVSKFKATEVKSTVFLLLKKISINQMHQQWRPQKEHIRV